MRQARGAGLIALMGVGAAVLTGCSLDAIIWGSDGARVIETTERFIEDVASTGTSDLVCADADLQIGARADWEGRSAGEPEPFTGELWPDEIPAPDAQWSINIEFVPVGAVTGDQIPGDVFYRAIDDDLCVIDIEWSTLELSR